MSGWRPFRRGATRLHRSESSRAETVPFLVATGQFRGTLIGVVGPREDPPSVRGDTGEFPKQAATLLLVMPPNQSRETIEELLSPNDRERGRQAVDALIDAALAAEDGAGHLRSLG